MRLISHARLRAKDETGFTMIAAIVVLLVASLVLAAAFAAANGDIKLTRTDLDSKKAYYAALAGVADYQYHLNSNPNYWTECKSATNVKVSQTSQETTNGSASESYSYKLIPATNSGYGACSTSNPNASVIEASGLAAGTFRLVSTGVSGKATRSVVATFSHVGFLNYVYYTNYEDLDPGFYEPSVNCAQHYAARKEEGITGICTPIQFITGDKLNGPVHTNDAADICGSPVFGRESSDAIEINGGTYTDKYCSITPEFVGTYTTEAPEILPPPTDGELATIPPEEYRFSGKTKITLKGNLSKPEEANTIEVENANINGGALTSMAWPANGVIYVNDSSEGCKYTYSPYDSIYTTDSGCGNAYVHGEYTKALTIGAANDVVINGNITTTTGTSKAPTGAGTLGLIATNYVRVYHPVAQSYTGSTSQSSRETPSFSNTSRQTPSFSSTARNTPTFTNTVRMSPSYSNTSRQTASIKTTSTQSPGWKNSCKSGYEYISATKLCSSTTCWSGETYLTGEGKCVKCNSGYFYLSSENKCASETCTSGTYIGEGKCAACNTGYFYLTSEKQCANETCTSGTYIGEGKCAKCENGYEYLTSEKTCASEKCWSSTYVGEGICAKCSSKDTYSLSEKACLYENDAGGCDAESTSAALTNPVIDAAILSTAHSFIVDNYVCGKSLGELTVWGAIAQNFRGTVGTSGGKTGYLKNYNYDNRLSTNQPPDYVNPTTAAWSVTRETQPTSGCTAAAVTACN